MTSRIDAVPRSPSWPRGVEPQTDEKGKVIRAEGTSVFCADSGVTYTAERAYWANVARAILPRFPEHWPGESIHPLLIKQKLHTARDLGLKVPNYSDLNKGGLWRTYREVRTEVRKKADRYCPEVLEEIDEANRRQKEDASGDLK